MSQLAITNQQPAISSIPKPAAAESLAKCKALFDGSHTRRQIRITYDKMSPRERGLICIAGGLKPTEYSRTFDSFDDLELEKIRLGMNCIKDMSIQFDRKLGDVRRLKHKQFSKTNS